MKQLRTLALAAIAIGSLSAGCRSGNVDAAAAPAGKAFDTTAVTSRLNSDGEFQIAARYWTAVVRMDVGGATYDLQLENGKAKGLITPGTTQAPDVTIAGPVDSWRDRATSALIAGDHALKISGDRNLQLAPYKAAINQLVGVVSESLGAKSTAKLMPVVQKKTDQATGHYIYVTIEGVQYRVYYEEAGQGIPMILQHTAGADSREWRHVLEDPAVTSKYRVIAYDMPFHGKSEPPESVTWWTQEYRLTTERLMDTITGVAKALNLDRPVYMGCSIGGYLAPDLAYYHPADYRAVIGINAAIAGSAALAGGRESPQANQPNTNLNPRVSTGAIGTAMYDVTSPVAPESYRRETGWIYSQGGPGIFAGDLYYFGTDHDLRGKADKIDTTKVGVYLLSGEFDPTAKPGPGSGQVLADAIKGSHFQIIKGASHFAMSDDYDLLRKTLVPVLDEIAQKYGNSSSSKSTSR